MALDIGITEREFWNMTPGEFERALDSYNRTSKARAREKAIMDYTLANLIGHSIARLRDPSKLMPDLHKMYPELFNEDEIEEKKQEHEDQLSALRFTQFAHSFNKRFKSK